MTYLTECGAIFQISLVWIHNDSMYVRFGGIRSTKTRSESRACADSHLAQLVKVSPGLVFVICV